MVWDLRINVICCISMWYISSFRLFHFLMDCQQKHQGSFFFFKPSKFNIHSPWVQESSPIIFQGPDKAIHICETLFFFQSIFDTEDFSSSHSQFWLEWVFLLKPHFAAAVHAWRLVKLKMYFRSFWKSCSVSWIRLFFLRNMLGEWRNPAWFLSDWLGRRLFFCFLLLNRDVWWKWVKLPLFGVF